MHKTTLHGSVLSPLTTPCEKTQVLSLHPNLEAHDPATASLFQSAFKIKAMTGTAAVSTASGADADTANCIESAWSKLKGPLLNAATKVCGLSRNHQWKPGTWWWNEEVDKAIQEKHAQFKSYRALKKGGMTAEAQRLSFCCSYGSVHTPGMRSDQVCCKATSWKFCLLTIGRGLTVHLSGKKTKVLLGIIYLSRDQWAGHTQFKPAPKYQRFEVDILLRGSQILHWWRYECTQNGLVCTDMILMLTFSCELWLLSTGYWRPHWGLLANRGINPGGITWPWTTGTLPVFQHSETNIVIKNVVFKYVP